MNEKQYINWHAKSDKQLCESIGKFIQHHRLNKNLSQDYVSKRAGISRSTLSLLERGGKVNLTTLVQVLRVMDLLSVLDAFRVQDEISPVAYAELQRKSYKRQRATGSAMVADPEKDDWEW